MTDDLITTAHKLIINTDRDIKEIAKELGLTPDALERRLERRYGKRSRGLRNKPTVVGRPRGNEEPRSTWHCRLNPSELVMVNAAIQRELSKGASNVGEALVRALATDDELARRLVP